MYCHFMCVALLLAVIYVAVGITREETALRRLKEQVESLRRDREREQKEGNYPAQKPQVPKESTHLVLADVR